VLARGCNISKHEEPLCIAIYLKRQEKGMERERERERDRQRRGNAKEVKMKEERFGSCQIWRVKIKGEIFASADLGRLIMRVNQWRISH
jgi:hypothetical protein